MSDTIPLNEVLNAIDRRDFGWYSALSDAHKKKWSSWLFLRYVSSVKGSASGDALLDTNEFVNKYYNDLYKHEELVWKLMCLTGTGKKQFHEWIKPPTSTKKKDKISAFISEQYPHMKADDIELFRHLNTDDDIKRMAVDMAMDDKSIDEIFGKTKRKKKTK
ncbi:hypothetical protein N9R43_01745 [bacterium]|nr:hypothetical protein [bacterium]